ncbi:RHS repeat-associated core domain-containing protein [Sorangium sp. So ce134]
MVSASKGGGGVVYFTYDAAGQRARKVYEHNGLIEERVYLGGWEVYRKRQRQEQTWEVVLERETLHMMDGERRVALIETKTIDTSVPAFQPGTVIRFQVGNQLGSAVLEVDDAGLVFSYEEYHPYGTTAYASGTGAAEMSRKRYRYTGKERDEETGLYYHGARYYAPWLGGWTAADPSGIEADGVNLYEYVRGNPVRLMDPSGTESTPDPAKYKTYEEFANAATLPYSDEALHKMWADAHPASSAQAKSVTEAMQTPAKVTKVAAQPVQEIRPADPLAMDIEKMRRAGDLSSIPPENKYLRDAAAKYLGYGRAEGVLREGESAKARIKAEIERFKEREASVYGEAVWIQMVLEKNGVLPPRLTGHKGGNHTGSDRARSRWWVSDPNVGTGET